MYTGLTKAQMDQLVQCLNLHRIMQRPFATAVRTRNLLLIQPSTQHNFCVRAQDRGLSSGRDIFSQLAVDRQIATSVKHTTCMALKNQHQIYRVLIQLPSSNAGIRLRYDSSSSYKSRFASPRPVSHGGLYICSVSAKKFCVLVQQELKLSIWQGCQVLLLGMCRRSKTLIQTATSGWWKKTV